jgi:hypothetical protein
VGGNIPTEEVAAGLPSSIRGSGAPVLFFGKSHSSESFSGASLSSCHMAGAALSLLAVSLRWPAARVSTGSFGSCFWGGPAAFLRSVDGVEVPSSLVRARAASLFRSTVGDLAGGGAGSSLVLSTSLPRGDGRSFVTLRSTVGDLGGSPPPRGDRSGTGKTGTAPGSCLGPASAPRGDSGDLRSVLGELTAEDALRCKAGKGLCCFGSCFDSSATACCGPSPRLFGILVAGVGDKATLRSASRRSMSESSSLIAAHLPLHDWRSRLQAYVWQQARINQSFTLLESKRGNSCHKRDHSQTSPTPSQHRKLCLVRQHTQACSGTGNHRHELPDRDLSTRLCLMTNRPIA